MFHRSWAVVLLPVAVFLHCGRNPTESLALPAIATQPQSQIVIAGNAATFIVVATGNPEPSYQWLKNDTVLPGKTAAFCTISAAALVDSGIYTAVVSNSQGTVTSDSAKLTVYTLPRITRITVQPASDTVFVDSAFTFTVEATGIPEPTLYEWRLNGFPVQGATSVTYTKAHAEIDDAGTYRIVVTNAAGSVFSDAILLTVIP